MQTRPLGLRAHGIHSLGRKVYQIALEQASAQEVVAGLVSLALPTPTLPPATATNHYLVGWQRAVLVDPSTPEPRSQQRLSQLIAALRQQGLQVQALFLTHHHRDHAGAAMTLARQLQLPVWAHATTAQLLADSVTVDRMIDDGEDVAQDATGSWHAVHTPGHAPGHLCLQHSQHRGVVAGDMVAGEGTILVDPSDGNMGQYLASLGRLRTLRPAFLAPAHGPVLHDADALLAHYQQHRLAREARIATALTTSWQEPADLLPTAYGDVSKLAWPLALRSMLSHLLHLQEQGLAQSQDKRWRKSPC